MLKVIEKHYTLKNVLQQDEVKEYGERLPGTVTAAYGSRRHGTFMFSTDDGNVFRMELYKAPVRICGLCGPLNSIGMDWNDRIIYVENRCIKRSNYDGTDIHTMAEQHHGEGFHHIGAASIHSNGIIYFTEYKEEKKAAVYFANPISLSVASAGVDVIRPTAVCHSADNNFLYIAESEQGYITKFNILGDGTLKYKRIYCFLDPDYTETITGMLVDREDNLFAITAKGIHIYAPGGMLIGVLETDQPCTAACFGGMDLKTLYMFCGRTLLSVKLKNDGAEFYN